MSSPLFRHRAGDARKGLCPDFRVSVGFQGVFALHPSGFFVSASGAAYPQTFRLYHVRRPEQRQIFEPEASSLSPQISEHEKLYDLAVLRQLKVFERRGVFNADMRAVSIEQREEELFGFPALRFPLRILYRVIRIE